MSSYFTRRTFVAGMGATAAALAVPSFAAIVGAHDIRFAYTAMTWGNDEGQGIADIADVGYAGVQLRANALDDFKPAELKDLLAQRRLTFVALSSGEVSLDSPEEEQIQKHVSNAQFVKDAGGLYLQVLDQLKTYPRTATPDECKRLGKLLSDIGRRTADIGIPLGYHNHLNTLSQTGENLDRILENADAKYVKLELDTAHIVAGGGDPAREIARFHDRLLFLHLKDVIDIPADTPRAKYPFKFVELGRGKVNLLAVFEALNKVKFSGWAVVELDHTTSPEVSAKESATISRDYLERKIGVKVQGRRL